MYGIFRALLLLIFLKISGSFDWSSFDLPTDHVIAYLNSHPQLKSRCLQDSSCPFKELQDSKLCWGYEDGCENRDRVSQAHCPGDSLGWSPDKESQHELFDQQADFGYVTKYKKQLTNLCTPQKKGDSQLKCTKFLQHCQAKNIYIDLRRQNIAQSPERYSAKLFRKGEIGGHCQVNTKLLKSSWQHKSPLQSWYAELEEYTELDFQPVNEQNCDIRIVGETILIKLDAGVNMYHHMCDFINLYATQHIIGNFYKNTTIIMWDTSGFAYTDLFEQTWKAFTNNPIIHLNTYDGKRVCIEDAVFSLLPRMRRGLFYNMPLVPGCLGSSLFKAFSHHIIHRLRIPQDGPSVKIRVTIIDRNSKYRRILNQDKLVDTLMETGDYEVSVVTYDHRMISLEEQLKITHNSDILIGMHGAGLTHLLFQPDWGVLFELYNCEDEHCYKDLARLRGLKYVTWENNSKLIQEDEGHHPQLGAHAKFTNYLFDEAEFLDLVRKAAVYVRNHTLYRQKIRISKDEL